MGDTVSQHLPPDGVSGGLPGSAATTKRDTALDETLMKLADWEKATEELAKKQEDLKLDLNNKDAAASNNSEESNKMNKSKSDYGHFSDFSMFPDRFNTAASKKKESPGSTGSGSGQSHFSDYSMFPDRFNGADGKRSEGNTPAGSTPGGSTSNIISKYHFRLRSASNSESDRKSEPPTSSSSTSSNNNPSGTDTLSAEGGSRPRACSHGSSKLYYFDFSCIPDKDPNCTLDEQKRNYRPRQRLYSTGDLPTHKEETSAKKPPTGLPSVVITEEESKVESTAPKNVPHQRRRKTSEPRFGFFDYSMIPDKDPRFFNPAKNDKGVDVKDT